ncbi:MAG: phosphatase PAP2 family protein [Desulfuromonadaceae bacterium]|nr:phosphatase PAP2 family protein [Desulfuromonadaceae bacterium]MDD5104902.1 phosphatase PAP2 family protein [Desulfuromonadaceae bacterium]
MTVRASDFIIPVCFLVLTTIVIAVTGADLALSSLFYSNGTWPIGNLEPWHLLYKLDRIPSFMLGGCSLVAALIGFFYQQRRVWLKPGLFLALLLVLGPGLLVNAVFKEYWGRPRPREVSQFNGTKQFLHPWQKGVSHQGRSFPSGHSSAAFYLSAPYFVLRRRRPRTASLWLTGGLLFGVAMSIARIAQGGHFLSDTLWAWGMVHLTAVALYYLLRLDRDEILSPSP